MKHVGEVHEYSNREPFTVRRSLLGKLDQDRANRWGGSRTERDEWVDPEAPDSKSQPVLDASSERLGELGSEIHFLCTLCTFRVSICPKEISVMLVKLNRDLANGSGHRFEIPLDSP